MEESIKMDKIKLITMSPLVLAYLGDTVYESYIREHLIRQNINRKVNNLHKLAIQYSKAKAQATIIHECDIKVVFFLNVNNILKSIFNIYLRV